MNWPRRSRFVGKGFDAALAVVNSDVGQKSMEAIEADTSEILAAAHARLQQRLDAAEVLDQDVALAFMVGSAIAAVGLVLSGLLLARAYRRAAASKSMLQATLESVREGIVAVDADRRVVAWNQTFKRMLKLPKGTMRLGKTLKAHQNPDIDKFESYFDALDLEVQRTGKPALVERREDGKSVDIFHSPTEEGGSVTTLLDRTRAASSRGCVAPNSEARGARPDDGRDRA